MASVDKVAAKKAWIHKKQCFKEFESLPENSSTMVTIYISSTSDSSASQYSKEKSDNTVSR